VKSLSKADNVLVIQGGLNFLMKNRVKKKQINALGILLLNKYMIICRYNQEDKKFWCYPELV